jgi:hypothetical protein
VEEDFLQAATHGLPALTVFRNTWSTLLSDTDVAMRSKTIKDETVVLGGVVASRIASLSNYLLEFQNSADEMQAELENLFARICISGDPDHYPPNSASDPHPTASPRSDGCSTGSTRRDSPLPSSDRKTCPPYIEPAYRWLLGNLHNPYPSRETREAISLQTSSHRRVIDAWFVDARKRIGWNALRKARFSNKRVDIVDAATRFLVQEDPKRPLDSNVELEFVAIETRAKDLYFQKFSESTLATKLDVAIKDMTPEMKAQAKEDKRRRKREEKEKRSAQDALATSSYPSPARSPNRSPVPSPSPLSEDGVQPLSDPDVSNKRRHPSLGPNVSGAVDQPSKRHRCVLCTSSLV